MSNIEKIQKYLRHREDFPKTTRVKGLSSFISKYKRHIDKRVEEIITEVKEKNKSENLLNEFSEKNIRDWVIWELLLAVLYKWKMSTSFFEEFDVFFLTYYLKIDVKTLRTKQDLSSSLQHLSLYLQEKQVKEDIIYVPCLLNYKNNEALLIVNIDELKWKNIKEKNEAIYKNPPFTSISTPILNYVIPYSLFYKTK